MSILTSSALYSQNSKKKTVEFEVKGVCNMCKNRIENAAYIKGVKFCEWSKETEKLKVVYNPQKVDIDAIHKSIAQAGHSTNKFKANQDTYNKLPACCAYMKGCTPGCQHHQ